jgi:hypothetical protein
MCSSRVWLTWNCYHKQCPENEAYEECQSECYGKDNGQIVFVPDGPNSDAQHHYNKSAVSEG